MTDDVFTNVCAIAQLILYRIWNWKKIE